MAQTPQEKLDQIRKQFEQLNNSQSVNPTTSAQTELAKQFYQRQQPLYWQWSIRGMTPAEKRKSRWQHAWDAAKWALSSIYWAAAFIPEVIWQIGAAWIDQLAWTNTQDKVDNFFWYIPNKLRDSAGSTYHFDKWQEYTDDALMAAALLTAWASWPKSPRAKLQDLAKNPWKYDPVQAWDIVRASNAAWVDWVKVWKVKLTPNQVSSKFRQNWDAMDDALSVQNGRPYTTLETAPAYQQKLWSEYNAAKNGNIMDTYRDIPSHEFRTYSSESAIPWYWKDAWYWKYNPRTTEINNLYTKLSPEEIENMKQYLAKDISDYLWLESEYESLWDVSYDTAKKLLKDYNEYRANIEKNNTSRARADALKKRNMSASERLKRAKKSSADERAKDSANEQYAALDADADMARNDVKNMTLEEMYELWKAIQNW